MKKRIAVSTLVSILLLFTSFIAHPILENIRASEISGIEVYVAPVFWGRGMVEHPYLEKSLLIAVFHDVDTIDPFSVDICITGVREPGLAGYQFKVGWNPAILDLTDAWFGPDCIYADAPSKFEHIDPPEEWIDGDILIGSSLVGASIHDEPFIGDGILLNMNFTVRETSQIGESLVGIFDVKLADPDASAITFSSIQNSVVDFEPVIPPNYIAHIEPLQLRSWYAEAGLIDFDLSLDGETHCRIHSPILAMDGPFTIILDRNWTRKTGYSVGFNASYSSIHLDFSEHSGGILNIKIIDSAWGDLNNDGKVDILDVSAVAFNFGKQDP